MKIKMGRRDFPRWQGATMEQISDLRFEGLLGGGISQVQRLTPVSVLREESPI
jgi:hypothetical protein